MARNGSANPKAPAFTFTTMCVSMVASVTRSARLTEVESEFDFVVSGRSVKEPIARL